jgi:hypothetical protein
MAVEKKASTQTTARDTSALAAARGRRILVGTNVVIMIAIALLLAVAVNWIAAKQHKRFDVANSGLYRLSDRTKRIIDDVPVKEIRLTSIYTSDDPEKDRDKYLPRVRDLFDEFESYSPKITVQQIATDDEKRKLIERVQGKYAGKSEDYRKAVASARDTWKGLAGWLEQTNGQFEQIIQGKGWLGGFTTFAKINGEMMRDVEELNSTEREVNDLVSGVTMPRYEEANRKIKAFNTKVKGHLEEARDWFKEMDKAMSVLGQADSEFAKTTAAKLGEGEAMMAELQKTVGDPSDESVPDDPKPVLQAYSRQVGKLSAWLEQEATRVDDFVKGHRAVATHYQWFVKVGPLMQIQLPGILSLVQQNLVQWDQRVRQILATDQPTDVQQGAVRKLRQVVDDANANMGAWKQAITRFLADWQQIDPASEALLAQARDGKLVAGQLDAIDKLTKQFDALPELKMADVVSKFDEDNIVVVEAGDKVKVVDFDEVWPQGDRMRMGRPDQEGDRRVFNGDAAIAAAILGLGFEKPFGTVVLTYFEPAPPPQMRQARAPRTGRIASASLSKLRERLEASNFVVKDWNLANDEPAPEPEEGTERIYVVLPPPGKQQQNPFQPRPPNTKEFGDAELTKVKEQLDKEGARAVFLACYLPPMRSFFSSQPAEYPYADYLRKTWGVDVEFTERVIRGVPDERDFNRYALSVTRWNWMRLNSFNKDNPIGAPLRARRCLFVDVCPVAKEEKPPEHVELSSILSVPGSSGRSDFWAERDVEDLVAQITSPRGDGTVVIGPSAEPPPFDVIVEAKNTAKKSRVIVHGAALGVVNQYMDERVPRIGAQDTISFDPPPRENGDLLINMTLALADKDAFIGAGPVVAPSIEPIGEGTQRWIKVLAVAWALVVLGVGGAVTIARRK